MTKTSTRIGMGIVAFWLVTMAALFQRDILPKYLKPAPPVAAIHDFDRWYGVYLQDDSRAGIIHISSAGAERDGEPGTELTLLGRMNLNLLNTAAELYAQATVWTPHGGGPLAFSGSMSSGAHVYAASGTIHEGMLHASVQTGDQVIPVTWPVGDLRNSMVLFSSGFTLPALETGESISLPAFDPITMRSANATVTAVGREILRIGGEPLATWVYETSLSGITSQVWVDGQGDVVQARTPFGFTLRRLAAEEADNALPAVTASDALAMASVVPRGKTPFRGARRMVIRMEGYDLNQSLPESENQRVDGENRIIITVPDPPDERVIPPTDVVARDEYLGADPFIQSSHPLIRRKAAEIAGDADGDWERAQRLYDWVYENIDKVPVPTIPSALDVLETREGDCNEHTVLYSALARALGVPTRVAVGLVWSDELRAFYYHAWPEVYVGHWVPMDPTLGQLMADATHIKLLEGDIQRWPQLIAFLGRTRIEVLEIE